jgi:hypothetical protein
VKRNVTHLLRIVVAAGVAAVLVAVAVPVAISMVNRGGDDTTPDPASSSSSSSSPTPLPTGPVKALLTTDAPAGPAAGIPVLNGGSIESPGSEAVPVEGTPSAVAPFGTGWLVVANDVANGKDTGLLTTLDSDGSVTDQFTGGLRVVTSADGSLTAYTDESGHVLTFGTDDAEPATLDPRGPMSVVELVAVVGSGSCASDEGCAVYYNEYGDLGGGFRIRDNGSIWQFTLFRKVLGAASDGRVAGLISASDSGSCSGVYSARETLLWKTCDYTVGAFSPDGRYVIGRRANLDGPGDGLVAILDSETGEMVSEFANNEQTQAVIGQAVWETDRTMLATVRQDGAWSLMRLTDLGELQKVADLEGGDEAAPPAFLP